MSTYLESLQADLAEAQRRFQNVQQEAARINLEFQAAHQDLQALQRIVEKQTKKEQTPEQAVVAGKGAAVPAPTLSQSMESSSAPDVKKTALIRDTLRQHAGMTPGELFDVVKSHVGRPYVYSVLKRLRDNEEVIVRRKKYYLKPTPKIEEERNQIVQ
jgi:hypothetical protein